MPSTSPAPLPTPAIWKYAICNRDGSSPRELVNVYDRKVIKPHMRLDTASGRVRLDHPLADRIATGDVLLKAYRNTVAAPGTFNLQFVGPVLTCEESGGPDGHMLQFNAAGSFFYVQNRLIGRSAAGQAWGTAGALVTRATIMRNILDDINGVGFTGVTKGTNTASTTPDAHFGPVTFSPAGQAITDIAVGLNAPEWRITPSEPTVVAGVAVGGTVPPQIGVFDTADVFKTARPNVVFEYGAGGTQVTDYKRTVSRESLLTYGYCLPQGFPTSGGAGADYTVQEWGDAAAQAARGRIEGVVPSDLVANDLRLALVKEHIAVRKGARYLAEWNLGANQTPRPFEAYDVGDTVRARSIVNGIVRFDAMFRVWGITADIDTAGNEKITLELAEPT